MGVSAREMEEQSREEHYRPGGGTCMFRARERVGG